MKATLSFNEEEEEQLNGALHAFDYYITLRDLDEFLRQRTKKDESCTEDMRKAYQITRDKLTKYMLDRGISLDDYS